MGKIAKKTIPRNRKHPAVKFSDNDLCARFKKGDFSAFTELLGMYERLANTIASKYVDERLPKSELILYAKIGLLKAAHRYDESKMVSFRLYAIWWMRQCVLKALNEQSRIEQIPEMLIQNMYEIMESYKNKIPYPNNHGKPLQINDNINLEISRFEKSSIRRINTRLS